VAAADASARAEEALEAVGLFAAADRLPAALSGGMRKRLGLARALVTTPRHLLLDDPIAGLDPVTAARIVRRLDTARRRAGGVVIAVGFETALMSAATHLLVLEAGKIAAFGAPGDARRAPEAQRLLGAEA
jgi:ABC-type transporter Mla maintaining outer membrane lipid asymmetry ATPase subunit MlaF